MYQAVMENKIVKSKKAKNSFIIGAALGIVGGFFLMVTGLILSAISYFYQISFRGLDMVLIVAAFIFLAIGSHFLDLMDEEKKAKRIVFCREHGLTDEECQEIKSAGEQSK